MQTIATNKKISELLSDIANGRLKLRPPFQRRLVWLNKHKIEFIKTVLDGYPFPEIFIATGELDVNTGEGTNVLVDGQQRLTTLRDYFTAAKELRLVGGVSAYADLKKDAKERFLNYVVVVRDLGKVENEQLRDAFARINATSYPLNAVELDNSRYEGAFKNMAQNLADEPFFSENEVFGVADIRRMRDLRFALRLAATVIDTYFNGYKKVEQFLERYNEEFAEGPKIIKSFQSVFTFVDSCDIPRTSRAWQQADLFTLLVEVYWALRRDKLKLDSKKTRAKLLAFYRAVDAETSGLTEKRVGLYRKAASLATNNRNNQIQRGAIIREILESAVQ